MKDYEDYLQELTFLLNGYKKSKDKKKFIAVAKTLVDQGDISGMTYKTFLDFTNEKDSPKAPSKKATPKSKSSQNNYGYGAPGTCSGASSFRGSCFGGDASGGSCSGGSISRGC